MKLVFPIRNWIKQSLLFSIIVATLVMLGTIMEGNAFWIVLDKYLSSFSIIFLVCLANIGIHTWARSENPLKSSVLAKCLSVIVSILILYISWEVRLNLISKDQILSVNKFQLGGSRLYVYLALQAVMIDFVVLLWLYFMMTQHAKVQIELENSRLAKAKSEAANQLLRQQIQPHFLFNALSTLKALIRKDSDMAEAYLLRLSDFLRVSVSANQQGLSSLKQEVKLCEDYLEMQKMRFKDALVYEINLPEDLLESGVLPLFSLQPLVDNAIKHNQFTRESPLVITICQERDWIAVENNRSKKNYVVASTGSGLSNLSERYKMLSEADIKIEQSKDVFLVKIKILGNEYSFDRR